MKDIAITSIDYTQAGIDYWSIPVRMLNNILNKDNKTSYTDALKDPVNVYINSVGRALNSTKDVYQGLYDSTKAAAKTSFDVAFAFPKFGLNLMGVKGQEVKDSLQKSYDTYSEIFGKAVNEYKTLGQNFAKAGSNLFKKFANATIVPQVNKILESATNGALSEKFQELGNKTAEARDYALKVAHKLTQGGLFFNKAGFDLEALLNKYSMKLISPEDAHDYQEILNKHINATKDSVRQAQQSFETAYDGVLLLFKMTEAHGNDLILALDFVKKNIKDSDPEALQMSKKLILDTYKESIEELLHVGKIFSSAGNQLVQTSFKVAAVIPKFGLSILKKEASLLGERFMALVNKLQEAVMNVVESVKVMGSNIVESGIQIERSAAQPQETFAEDKFPNIIQEEE